MELFKYLKISSHRVKLLFYSNKSALEFFCLKLVTNMSGYGYLYQKMKINEGFCPKSHILPTMKNFPEIGLKCNKIYDARWCKAKNLCCPCKEFFNWSRGFKQYEAKTRFSSWRHPLTPMLYKKKSCQK